MKKTMTYASLFLVIALAGCAQMMNIGQVSENYSKFDNSRQVYMSPAFVWSEPSGQFAPAMGVKIGAAWSSNTPEIIQLTATYSGTRGPAFAGIETMAFNADGQIINGRIISPFTRLEIERVGLGVAAPTSMQHFAFTRQEIEQVISAQRAVVQVHTSAGTLEGFFSNTLHEDQTAKFGLTQMLTKI